MKKLIFILLVIDFLFSGKVLIIGQGCNVRSELRVDNNIIAKTYDGYVHNIIGMYGSWKKVRIIKGSKHVGKIGWMWSKRIKYDMYSITVVLIKDLWPILCKRLDKVLASDGIPEELRQIHNPQNLPKEVTDFPFTCNETFPIIKDFWKEVLPRNLDTHLEVSKY